MDLRIRQHLLGVDLRNLWSREFVRITLDHELISKVVSYGGANKPTKAAWLTLDTPKNTQTHSCILISCSHVISPFPMNIPTNNQPFRVHLSLLSN
jgi:hypothetical protein